MAEEQKEPQITKELQQRPAGPAVPAVMKEPLRVTTKNLKKVEAGKRLAVHNHRRREEQRKEQVKLEKSDANQYYEMGSRRLAGPIGAVIALGVIGGLVNYIYQSKKREQPLNPKQNNP